MSIVGKGDLSVWPAAYCRGRKPAEQAILAWLFHEELVGNDWSLKRLSELAGVSAESVKSALSIFVQDGLLEEVPETERKSAKASDQYRLRSDYVPNSPAKAPGSPVVRSRLPGWVFVACGVWKRYKGVYAPKRMHNDLKAAVQLEGEAKVIKALERYAKESEARFNPSPAKMAAQVKMWIGGQEKLQVGKSFADMAKEMIHETVD